MSAIPMARNFDLSCHPSGAACGGYLCIILGRATAERRSEAASRRMDAARIDPFRRA